MSGSPTLTEPADLSVRARRSSPPESHAITGLAKHARKSNVAPRARSPNDRAPSTYPVRVACIPHRSSRRSTCSSNQTRAARPRIDPPSRAATAARVRNQERIVIREPPIAHSRGPPCPYRASIHVISSSASSAFVQRSSASRTEIHAEEPGVFDGHPREHRLVSDRQPMLVRAHLRAPHPRRSREHHLVGLRHLVELDVGCTQSAPPPCRSRGRCSTTCASPGSRSLFFANQTASSFRPPACRTCWLFHPEDGAGHAGELHAEGAAAHLHRSIAEHALPEPRFSGAVAS